MRIRDTYIKPGLKKKTQFKDRIVALYKCYRNMIVTLYFSSFFIENQNYAKKTWDDVQNLINVLKKKNSTPTKLIYKNKEKTNNMEMAESLSDFFVNIGSSVQSKILSQSNILFPI